MVNCYYLKSQSRSTDTVSNEKPTDSCVHTSYSCHVLETYLHKGSYCESCVSIKLQAQWCRIFFFSPDWIWKQCWGRTNKYLKKKKKKIQICNVFPTIMTFKSSNNKEKNVPMVVTHASSSDLIFCPYMNSAVCCFSRFPCHYLFFLYLFSCCIFFSNSHSPHCTQKH